ncbi:MAG: hypothetical protein WC974_03695 [Thermoplasmata archaeon]
MTSGEREINEYMAKVRFHLLGLSEKDKENILKELKDHISESSKKGNEIDDVKVKKKIAELGSPRKMAIKYKDAYDYSPAFKLLFIVIGGFLSTFTIPLSAYGYFSAVVLSVTFLYVTYISLRTNKRFGSVLGTVCGIERLVVLGMFLAASKGYSIGDSYGIVSLALVSLIIPMVGFLPAYYKESYNERIGEE